MNRIHPVTAQAATAQSSVRCTATIDQPGAIGRGLPIVCLSIALALTASAVFAQPDAEPVFDVHLHALSADAQGPPPVAMCTPMPEFPPWDQRRPYAEQFLEMLKTPECAEPIWSPTTDEELLERTLTVLRRNNVYGVLSGTPERVARWRAAAPDRFLAGLGFNLANSDYTVAEIEEMFSSGSVEVFAEITNQYAGIAPDDERMEPFWSLAESLDIPVGIHIGNGPPGVHYMGASGYRATLHSALTLEPVLVRHPKLRVYIMHAGYPLVDDLLALLYAHPQVHVGLGVLSFTLPDPAFHGFLRRIVDAGFGRRVLFGSDQMVWPETVEFAIERVRNADYLSTTQKRAILYDNAARFFRFDEATMERHRQAAAPAQPPATDIVLLRVDRLDDPSAEAIRVTDRNAYDNQPKFLPDGRLAYTAAADDGTTDIVQFDPETGERKTLFDLPESLYSPTPVPGAAAISVIRDYGNQVQQLWRLPLDGSSPSVLQDQINPIGYHAWIDEERLILFVLGDPPTLQQMTLGSGTGELLAERPGRSLAKIPGARSGSRDRSTMSFTRPADEPDDEPAGAVVQELMAFDPETRAIRSLVRLRGSGQDYAWAPDGTLWQGVGTELHRWDGSGWTRITDLAERGLGAISRLAFSADGAFLAVVVNR